jgi:hypothetical protein
MSTRSSTQKSSKTSRPKPGEALSARRRAKLAAAKKRASAPPPPAQSKTWAERVAAREAAERARAQAELERHPMRNDPDVEIVRRNAEGIVIARVRGPMVL